METTLRQLIFLVENNQSWQAKLFKYLNKRDVDMDNSRIPLLHTTEIYSRVMDELKSKKSVKSNKFPISVKKVGKFIDVALFNPNYVSPKKGLLPYGGRAPKGYYNCNLDKYNQYFGFGYLSWSSIIDTPVIRDVKIPLYVCLAEILWEMTFHGFTEKQVIKFNNQLKVRLKNALEQSKAGKLKSYTPEEFKKELEKMK